MGDHRDEVEDEVRNFQGCVMKEIINGKEATARIESWMIVGGYDQSDEEDSSSSEGSDVSSASTDMRAVLEEEEDVSSSSSSSSNGPLYELSELLAQLPPTQRSGLSRHYQGKSQSFSSLANVKSVEDLAKRAKPYDKSMKRQCKYYTTPKAMISKTNKKKKKTCSSSSRISFLSSVSKARGSFFLRNSSNNSVCKSPISVQKQKSFG